ncbi:MAG: alpha-amylase family glycosyl hydrolase [Bacteroidales bacterium]
MKRILLLVYIVLIVSFLYNRASGQIVVTPATPNDLDSISVVFNATMGNGGLAGYTGDIYAHTGVITNLSANNSDWKYVKAGWGVNIPECKLTQIGSDLYQLKIGPSIRQYYGVPAGEDILRLAFVFRSGVQVGGVWLEGKTSQGGDIFWDVYPSGLFVKFTNPADNILIVNLNSTTTIQVNSFAADSTLLYQNDQLLTYSTGTSLSYSLVNQAYGPYWVKAIAKNDTGMVADSFYCFVRQPVINAEVPQGIKEGINYLNDTSVILCLNAPSKQYAFVIGDFNNWLPGYPGYMKRSSDGKRYWVQIDGLTPGQQYIYQYLVDGTIRIGDPYAEKVSDPWSDQYLTPDDYPNVLPYPFSKTQGMATVLQTGQTPYTWQSGVFTPPDPKDLVIYELLIRDFSEEHSFQSVIDNLGYLISLGINAIELMPVSEFEGNISWGYNPNFYFAVDKYYGHANNLKRLIDTCHQLGIAVISDVVFNHSFGSSPYVMLYWDGANNRPAANSPYYNPIAKHDFNVGYDMNHESVDVKYYISNILKFWLQEYRFDGYRFDLSKGFTQTNTLGNTSAWANYDQGRINILTRYYDTIKSVNPDAYLILEHFADNTEEKALSNSGMLIWGNMNWGYRYASMGITTGGYSDLSWGSYLTRGWTNSTLVTYMESHDEERQMVYSLTGGSNNGPYNIKDTATALKRMQLNAAFFFTIPGPKMIWQFGERGYDYSINWPCMTSACRLDPKPPRWDYLDNWRRREVEFYWSQLIKLKKQESVFETSDFSLDVANQLKKIRLRNDDMKVVVLGNFGVQSGNIIPNFYNNGTWYDYFKGDSIEVTNINSLIQLAPGEFRLYTSKKLQTPVGTDELPLAETGVMVYPNPSAGSFTIDLAGYKGMGEVTLYSIHGKLLDRVFSGQINPGMQLPMNITEAGIYILDVKIGNIRISKKVVRY